MCNFLKFGGILKFAKIREFKKIKFLKFEFSIYGAQVLILSLFV